MSGGGQSQGGGFNNYGGGYGGFNNFNKGPNYGSAFGPSTMRSPMGYPGSRTYQNPTPPNSVTMAVDNNWYERGQFPPTQAPQNQPPMAVDNNWYERGQRPTLEKPMMSLPYGETQPAPQKQPPPGYYFAQNGQMLLGQDPNKGAPNAFGGAGTGAPYDPRTPGYQPGAGWQTMLRQDAMSNGADPNQYIRDRGMNPMWGSEKQPWEPAVPPGGMGLSQLLQYFRGY